MMKNAKMKDLLRASARILQSLLIANYLGPYRYHTLEPIQKIERHQEDDEILELIKALAEFRHTKDEELSFVAKAVGQDLLNPSIPKLRYRELSYATHTGCLIWSSGHRCLLMACHGEDSVGRENALELEFLHVYLLAHRLGSHTAAPAPAPAPAR